MLNGNFATGAVGKRDQFEAWCDWYSPVFQTTSGPEARHGFVAANSNWTVGGLTISEVSSPPVTVTRTSAFIRHNPVDHWVLTLSESSSSEVATRGERIAVGAGTPFLLSLGEEMSIRRPDQERRMQILLSRDSFGKAAALLDGAVGTAIEGPRGRLLKDFLGLLRRSVSDLTEVEAGRLVGAVQAVVETCLVPAPDRIARAEKPINATLMERVRKVVSHHLRSPSLSTDKLCQEAGTSRSQLYRLLEDEGGVAHYIQRRRLSESFAILCDTSHDLSIGRIAEMLCFADASGFSRAFRREFGISPRDVRTASLGGLPPVPPSCDRREIHTFRDCLKSF